MSLVKQINLKNADEKTFRRRFSGCVVITHDGKILLQKVVYTRKFFPAGSIITFGGRIEVGKRRCKR